MLSKNGFLIGFVLSISPMSLHDLRRTMIFQGIDGQRRDEMLVDGLSDLCKHRLLIWSFEPDYGNKPSVTPSDYGETAFLEYWREFIARSDLSAEAPDCQNPTLSLEGTLTLNEEVDKTCYDDWRKEIGW